MKSFRGVLFLGTRYVFASFGKICNELARICKERAIVFDEVLYRRLIARVGYRLANRNLGTMLLSTNPAF